MTLSASGQWLVDAGMRLMSRSDQAAWLRWTREFGWSPANREPKRLSPDMASLALGAIDKLVDAIHEDIDRGRLSESDELDAANDLDLARVVVKGLQEDTGAAR